MKNKLLLPLFVALLLSGCSLSSFDNSTSNTSSSNNTDSSSEYAGSAYDYNSSITVSDPEEISVEETSEEFSLTTEDGSFTKTNNLYTITSSGTYVASGKLNGQIVIDATEDDEVVLELNGVSISYDQDSPIKGLVADKIEISAKKDTENSITDNRSVKTNEDENQGEGAISSKTDLKLKGSGTLVVVGNYNNGIHTTKDLTIQKETLKVTGYNNAIKGKNSVTIESGEVQAYALIGNGIKTDDSGVTSSGKQKGTVTINGGTVYIDSLHDAIDAVYNVVVDEVDSNVATALSIKTGTKSSVYNRSNFKIDSEKGIKAANDIIINGGTTVIEASDDAIHANYGTTLDNGSKGTGNITVNGGIVKVASGDDGLHSDNTLTINGGYIVVTGATEGFEANYITINGGRSYVYGTDDGVNCSKKTFSNCVFTMNDGYLDVAVNNGDTDGIDTNGDAYIYGGVIVTRGAPGSGSGMSTGLDVEETGTCKMTGGTLISFNGLERTPTISSNIYYASTTQSTYGGGMGVRFGGNRPGQGGQSTSTSGTISAGEYTLTGDGINITFINDYSYSSFLIYSSSLVKNSTYTLARSGDAVYSWTQSSNSVTIS